MVDDLLRDESRQRYKAYGDHELSYAMLRMANQTPATVAGVLIEAADRIRRYADSRQDESDAHTEMVDSEHDEDTDSS